MPQASEERVFSGTALLYGQPVYIDLNSGRGVAEVMARMKGFLDRFGCWHAGDESLGPDDLRQEARAAMLEGLRAYDPSRKTQLSTFLQCHVRNRMVDVCRRARPACPLDEEPSTISGVDPESRIDLRRAIARWEERWRRVIFGIVVEERSISEVAESEGMTPWGLSRAMKRRLASVLKGIS